MKLKCLSVCVVAVGALLVWACGDEENGAGASSGGSSSGASGTSGGTSGQTSGGPSSSGGEPPDGGPTVPPPASCTSAGGGAIVSAPTLLRKLTDDGQEGWLASPAIADLDNDGKPEVVAARGGRVFAWRSSGQRAFVYNTTKDRIWASPIVGNFTGDAKLEVAVAARDTAYLITDTGAAVGSWPKTWTGSAEMRTAAAGDVDGDGALDLVVGARSGADIVNAFTAGAVNVAGFPPVGSGASGCTPGPCYFAGLYDQNLAIGSLDGDAKQDLVLPHDNAYASFFKGTGAAFDSNAIYRNRPKTPGVRYLHDLDEAKQGFANDEATANQAHFTNTPPAIADIDKDGKAEIIMVGSVQNAAQSDRLRGVDVWVVGPDATRKPGWETPFHVPGYVMGLNDGFAFAFDGAVASGAGNLVGLTNQVTVADIDASKTGLEMIFAGFDGKIHALAADKTELWAFSYATDGRALTAGVVVADLSADGVPEIAFTTYSPDQGGGALFILSSAGQLLHKLTLPTRGSMAVPSIGDVDGAGTLSIVVSLKDANTGNENVLVYQVPGSKPNCLLWPTGRASLLRNGWVR